MLAAALGLLLPVALLAGGGDEPRPDTVKLQDGTVLTGRVVYEDDGLVLLRERTKDREIPRASVADVQSADRELSDLLDWLETARDGDALVARAAELQQHGLLGEARLLRLKALLATPDHAGANTALGNRKQGKGWTWKRGHKSLPVTQLDAAGAAWDERWELDTLHYHVASNLPLSQVLAAAIDLERERRALIALFRGKVRIVDGDDVLGAELHADKASYPESVGARLAYYDPEALTLYVNAEGGPRRDVVAHEATHQILHVGTQRTKAAKGEVPSWLSEGLADFVRYSMRGDAGHVSFDFQAIPRPPLAVHAASPEPYDLKRLLTMDAGDFGASTKVELKYAQACSLVSYGLLGDGGSKREAFFHFVALAWDGHSSMSDFKASVGEDLDAYEKAWTAWVKKSV